MAPIPGGLLSHRCRFLAILVILLLQAACGYRFKTNTNSNASLGDESLQRQAESLETTFDDQLGREIGTEEKLEATLDEQLNTSNREIHALEAILEGSSEASRSAAKANARFLIEATFGPNRASMRELEGMSMEAWISKQMSLPASSHRAYYRERVNPRWIVPKLGAVAPELGACDRGARWSNVAIQDFDRLKPIKVKDGKIFVDGQLRTEVDPNYVGNELPVAGPCTNVMSTNPKARAKCETWKLRTFQCGLSDWVKNKKCIQKCWDAEQVRPGFDCSASGWVNFDYEGVICMRKSQIGGRILLTKTKADCENGGKKEMRLNPAVWFSSLKAAQAADGSKVGGLIPSPWKNGTIILMKKPAKCQLSKVLFYKGKYYLQESRYALLENTVESPAAISNYETCPTVPRNIFNKKDCQVKPTCTHLDDIDAEVTLDVALRKSLLKYGGNYVYKVNGLKHTQEPCKVSSRWQLCKRCEESKLKDAQKASISQALAEQSGDIRDITVNCAGVPAGSVVGVAGQLFENVHPHTGNVYDFSDWVDEHPGGPEKIQQWAKDNFELTFPKHHPMERWHAQTTQNTLHLLGLDGTTVNFQDLPSSLQPSVAKYLQESDDATASQSTGYLTCGSPNEVASDPEKGHNMHFYEFWGRLGRYDDRAFDNMISYDGWNVHKQAVWFTLAMQAEDQLRQRVAWALSQIIVASSTDFEANLATERTLAYYDIFVRNAFGNYRDILREVTFSPLMARWLTYLGSTSFDHNRHFADENYAREVMQLFSIGIWKLNMDGTVQKDENGEDVPAYDNDDIMSLARVFTGFDRRPPRVNVEDSRGRRNDIDPLRVVPKLHDLYPKTDLDKNYIGDRYPLCSDLPQDAFLRKGAAFEFVGYDYKGTDVLTPPSASQLFVALCGAKKKCDFKGWVELPRDLECIGVECDAKWSIIRVQSGYYRYVPPACVNFFFWPGQMRLRTYDGWKQHRTCSNPALPVAGVSCCAGCKNKAPKLSWKECKEFHHDQTPGRGSKDCSDVSCEQVEESLGKKFFKSRCNASRPWNKGRICERSCFEAGAGYSDPIHDCSLGNYRDKEVCRYKRELVSYFEAQKMCGKEGMNVCGTKIRHSCQYEEKGDYVWLPTSCSFEIQIDADGKVRYQRGKYEERNPVIVRWENGDFPVAGECPVDKGCREVDDVEACICSPEYKTEAVFGKMPSANDVLTQLFVGAFPPKTTLAPFQTKDGVKAYSQTLTFDEKTIFEYKGKFYMNVRNRVLAGGFAFRNAPVFIVPELKTVKAVEDEVEALLDYLVHHPNAAPFLAHRFIQHFTSSNPSPSYVKAVADAFITGSYGGKTYSGTYGDLGALVAAVLLHPEARNSDSSGSESNGAFREPLLKIVHFMRSMEYTDSKSRALMLSSGLSFSQGQFPHASPTVFNFFKPDYTPARFEEEHPTLVGPEFEIFTTNEALNFVNTMQKTVTIGSLTGCGGFGVTGKPCTQGHFALNDASTTIDDLDLVLTGGRLDASRSTVQRAYDNAKEGEKLKAAEMAMLLSPEFHTLGAPQPAGKRSEVKKETPSKGEGYKAMVLLYFSGGADTWNVLVPLNANCKLYDEYRQARTSVALGPEDLLEIKTKGQACSKFGIHKGLPFFKELYDLGEAAFVSNVGNLAEPMTKADMSDPYKKKCKGLFGHIDQTNSAMTLQCQTLSTSPKGSGGRMADALGQQGYATTSFSVAGAVPWTGGFRTATEMINRYTGSTRVNNLETLEEIIVNITSTKHKNVYCEEYAQQMANSLESSKKMAAIFDSAKLATRGMETSNGGLSAQLKQVSKLIATRKERSAERDFFYVSLGGWDMHEGLLIGMEKMLEKVDGALKLFVEEMKAQDMWKDVVLTTMSDFGRTLMSNGAGSDHAWAGNHLVMGGSIKGGVVYNDFPESMLLGSDMDLGRGRLIPKYPYESVFVPIAKWMGVEEKHLATVFPNLNNFNSSQHFINNLF